MSKFLQVSIVVTISIFNYFSSFCQAPSNDNCNNAILLTVGNGSCTNAIVGTNVGATDSGINPVCGGHSGGDVWYSFIAPPSGDVIIQTDSDNGTFLDTGLAILSSCGSAIIACDDDAGPASFSRLNMFGLTPGATYYLAVWEFNNDNFGTFTICAWEVPQPPVNDDCVNALMVPVNPDLSCSSIVSSTVAAATQSSTALSCNGSFDDDVWFKFVATATEHQVSINNISGSVIDMVYQFAEGSSCSTLSNEYCHDVPDVGFTATMLTVGMTYYLRVATFVATPGQDTSFDICIGTLPSVPPINDECVNATPLTVGQGVCNRTNITNAGATTSQTVHTCANYMGGDIWFSFVAPASGQVNVETWDDGNNRFGDPGHAVYDQCGAFANLLDCDDDDGIGFFTESILVGLTPGATYYIAVWEEFNDAIIFFDICVYDPTGTAPNCPTLSTAPTALSISSQSTCTSGCVLGGGAWNLATNVCPTGSSLQNFASAGVTTGGSALTSPPIYNQSISETFHVRCVCDTDATVLSPVQTISSSPGSCTIPPAPILSINDNSCPITTGNISASGLGNINYFTGTTLLNANNNAWSNIGGSASAPSYTAFPTVVYVCAVTTNFQGCRSAPNCGQTNPVNCNTGGCPATAVLTGTESGTVDTEVTNWIESDQSILAGATIDYDAATYILLKNNFEVNANASFHAFIDGCGGAMLDNDKPADKN